MTLEQLVNVWFATLRVHGSASAEDCAQVQLSILQENDPSRQISGEELRRFYDAMVRHVRDVHGYTGATPPMPGKVPLIALLIDRLVGGNPFCAFLCGLSSLGLDLRRLFPVSRSASVRISPEGEDEIKNVLYASIGLLLVNPQYLLAAAKALEASPFTPDVRDARWAALLTEVMQQQDFPDLDAWELVLQRYLGCFSQQNTLN